MGIQSVAVASEAVDGGLVSGHRSPVIADEGMCRQRKTRRWATIVPDGRPQMDGGHTTPMTPQRVRDPDVDGE